MLQVRSSFGHFFLQFSQSIFQKHSNSTSSSASTGASTGGSTGEASTKGTEKKKVRNEADAMNKEMMELAANCEKNAPNADKFMLEKKNFEVTSLIRGTKKDGAYFIHDDNNNVSCRV